MRAGGVVPPMGMGAPVGTDTHGGTMAVNSVESTAPRGGARLVDDEGRPVRPLDDDLPPVHTPPTRGTAARLPAALRRLVTPERHT